MTDNEIINALECCNKPVRENSCTECVFYRSGKCSSNMINSTLDLINRQKAEIEGLEKEVKDKERAYNDEFCLRKEWQSKCRELLKEKQITKSEAIKDFAERLKRKATVVHKTYSGKRWYEINDYDIDNLVKEMTEEIEK